MAKPRKPRIRPKITKEFRLDVRRRIGKKPEIGFRGLLDDIMGDDARNIVYLWSKPIGMTMTMDDMLAIWNAPTKKEANALYKKLVKDRSGEYEPNPAVFTRIKATLNKGLDAGGGVAGDAIYGASGLGYVLERDLNMDRAARWLYPRIKQQQHENIAANTCVNMIEQCADSPERKAIAKSLRAQATGGMRYGRLKNISEGLKTHFLQNKK